MATSFSNNSTSYAPLAGGNTQNINKSKKFKMSTIKEKFSLKALVASFELGHDLWDPSHRFETSWLLTPWALFYCRALIVRIHATMGRLPLISQ